MLKPLGIGSGNVGPENSRARGYKRDQFQEAFERYLAPEVSSELHRCTEGDEIRTSGVFEPHSEQDGCALGKCEKPNNDGPLGGCAVARGGIPPNGGDEAGLSDYRVRQLAGWYLDRADAERRETGTLRQTELDAALRKLLADDGVFPEFIAVEFERIMCAVFAS